MFQTVPRCSVVFQCSVVPIAKKSLEAGLKIIFLRKNLNMLSIFFAGMVLGTIITIALFYTIGRRQAKKAINQVDQQVKNVLINNLNN